MPKLSKQFYLEISVEQFLQACSPVELHEINMRLDVYLRKAERKENEDQYRNGTRAIAEMIALPPETPPQ